MCVQITGQITRFGPFIPIPPEVESLPRLYAHAARLKQKISNDGNPQGSRTGTKIVLCGSHGKDFMRNSPEGSHPTWLTRENKEQGSFQVTVTTDCGLFPTLANPRLSLYSIATYSGGAGKRTAHRAAPGADSLKSIMS
jgi:hypothetical protein